jgi:acetyl-CoA synthetase
VEAATDEGPNLAKRSADSACRVGRLAVGKNYFINAMKQKIYQVPENFAAATHIRRADYERMYAQSVEDPDRFWACIGQRLDWIELFSVVKDTSYAAADFRIRWFNDGKLNVASNCLDCHLETRDDKTAIIREADDPERAEYISYGRLYERICQCANALKSLGVAKGDRVTIYLPMVPEIAIAMLACARIGAIHSVVFGGFSGEALGSRIADCDSSVVITVANLQNTAALHRRGHSSEITPAVR